MKELTELRARIDEDDDAMLAALARRLATVEDVLTAKEEQGLPLLDPQREAAMLEEAARRAASNGLQPQAAQRVLREVIRISREIQVRRLQAAANPDRPPSRRVAYQGAEGAFSSIAARRHLGEEVETQGCPTFAAALQAVAEGTADLACLPIENTLVGSIHEVLDLLAQGELCVVGEEVLRIEHYLVGVAAVDLDQVRRILSHPVSLQQCSQFLRRLPQAECLAWVDSAEAAAKVRADGDPTQVAITSRLAAERFGLTILREEIADHPLNYTRFWIIGKEPVRVDLRVPARTSLLLVTDHREGALFGALGALATHGVNMTRLESRPLRGTPFQYSFFIDLEGNLAEPRLVTALDGMRARARILRVLGCYPKAQGEDVPHSVGAPLPDPMPSSPDLGRPEAPADVVGETPALRPSNGPLHSRARRAEPTVIKVGAVEIGGEAPMVVIAGPCAVESREQILAAAEAVRAAGGRMLRGGAYKPRTSPYSFQGLGAEGVELLAEAGRAFGLPVVSEVMAPELVASMAEKVDVLQVGARNMQNYPLLREIGRCHRPVLLKRGMSATLDELLQAAEYILAGGNQQVILCERGIRTFDNAMRFTLDLGAVVVLRERTHLPILVDPSHAAGRRDWVPPLARAARAVGCAGLMIEVHPEPAKARSDPDQALDPRQFAELMASL